MKYFEEQERLKEELRADRDRLLERELASWVLPMSLSRGLSRAGGPGEKLFKKMKMIFLSS